MNNSYNEQFYTLLNTGNFAVTDCSKTHNYIPSLEYLFLHSNVQGNNSFVLCYTLFKYVIQYNKPIITIS